MRKLRSLSWCEASRCGNFVSCARLLRCAWVTAGTFWLLGCSPMAPAVKSLVLEDSHLNGNLTRSTGAGPDWRRASPTRGGVVSSTALSTADKPGEEHLFPSLELNQDFTKILKPSNHRDWSPDQAVLAYVELSGEQATVHNVRHITYRTLDDYTVTHYDKTFDLGKLTSVDFIVVPFNNIPGVGHTMLSFGFEDRDYLGVSVEIRKEKGEKYAPLMGILRQYELIYVVADERDLLLRRVLLDLSDVYVYRARATPAQVRALFVDVMRRVNKLADQPEFYNTLTNNCTTNIRNHINHLVPDRVPYDYRVLLPGNSDKLAYDLGLIETDTSFEQTRARARVNYLAYLYRDDPDFSQKIRQ